MRPLGRSLQRCPPSLDGHSKEGVHLLCEGFAMVLVPAVAANPPDWADGTHRLELTLCLPSRADDADGRRIVSRKVFRRHSGRSPGPLLAEAVRLNHGDEFSGTDVDQVNP